MEDLIKAAEALITYVRWGSVFDTGDNDGDGYFDHSQSTKLKELIDDLQVAIDDNAPVRVAMESIKEGIITLVQTAIARQTQQP